MRRAGLTFLGFRGVPPAPGAGSLFLNSGGYLRVVLPIVPHQQLLAGRDWLRGEKREERNQSAGGLLVAGPRAPRETSIAPPGGRRARGAEPPPAPPPSRSGPGGPAAATRTSVRAPRYSQGRPETIIASLKPKGTFV